ncbi:MAG TPA: hypothetical protein VKG38_19365 [Solirubrobacteraceae bacterium]|nr:hypothetical protein [Solirubrobacteraceae bacterium]
MGTRITFTAAAGSDEPLMLEVSEDPEQVETLVNRAGGVPFRLTGAERGDTLYVNPLAIAYWVGYEA